MGQFKRHTALLARAIDACRQMLEE